MQLDVAALADLAVAEAKLSVAEDESPRPKVGALLVDPATGEVVLAAHRGEIAGSHAEFCLFSKARQRGIATEGLVLFTTLEPCTTRGVGKTPCVEHVLAAKVSRVFIGTLDPNPMVTGRGETRLSLQDVPVLRFPWAHADALRALNERFNSAYVNDHVPPAWDTVHAFPSKALVAASRKGADRNRLLQATLDLVSSSKLDISIRAGDASWIREAFLHLTVAAQEGRRVRLLLGPQRYSPELMVDIRNSMGSLGEVRLMRTPASPKWTACGIDGALVIDRASAVYLDADDEGLLGLLEREFAASWEEAQGVDGAADHAPTITSLPLASFIDELRASVPQYQRADIELETIDPRKTLPLTTRLEHFKLNRLRQVRLLHTDDRGAPVLKIGNSPWLVTPPVVEVRSEGLIVIDGTHRMYEALDRGERVSCLMVRKVEAPLPAQPVASWLDVRPSFTKISRVDRYVGFDAGQFRAIRDASEAVGRAPV